MSHAKTRILLIDDEPDVRRGLRQLLEKEGFACDEAADGPSALAKAAAAPPDAAVLDLMIPGLDGFAVCRELRRRGATFPVLILSARSAELDKVLGFELGADDYVTKPFSVLELLARLRSLLRRSAPRPGEASEVLRIGEVEVDLRRFKVQRGKEELELFHFEAEILKLLAQRGGEPVSRHEILDTVWGRDAYPTTRTVDFHVCNLRKKIERDPARPEHLLTVHSLGYRLVR